MILQRSKSQRISSPKDKEVHASSVFPNIVCVTWVDAETIGGPEWLDKPDAQKQAKEPLPVMVTIGFLIYESEDQVALSSTIGPNEMAQINKIPKRMILNLEEYRYGKS